MRYASVSTIGPPQHTRPERAAQANAPKSARCDFFRRGFSRMFGATGQIASFGLYYFVELWRRQQKFGRVGHSRHALEGNSSSCCKNTASNRSRDVRRFCNFAASPAIPMKDGIIQKPRQGWNRLRPISGIGRTAQALGQLAQRPLAQSILSRLRGFHVDARIRRRTGKINFALRAKAHRHHVRGSFMVAMPSRAHCRRAKNRAASKSAAYFEFCQMPGSIPTRPPRVVEDGKLHLHTPEQTELAHP